MVNGQCSMVNAQRSPSEKVGELIHLKLLFLLAGLDLIVGEIVETQLKLDDESFFQPVAPPLAGYRLEGRPAFLALLPKIHADGSVHLLVEVGTLEESTVLVIDMQHNGLKFHSFRLVLQQLHNLVVV